MTPSVDSLLGILESICQALHHPPESDAIHDCPPSALFLLPTRPKALIELSHTKIHSFPFSQVPLCWLRLYTDASILEAANVIRNNSLNEDGKSSHSDARDAATTVEGSDWIQEVVRLLDMAIIMTGAPERIDTIASVFSALQSYLEDVDVESRPRKRRRMQEPPCFVCKGSKTLPTIQRPVQVSDSMGISQFEEHLQSARPILIRNALGHWPALEERPWKSPEYLFEKTLGGRRLVPVELGRSYTDEGWGQSIITFRQFVDQHLLQKSDDVHTSEDNEQKGSRMGYLAQHDLFAQIPSLRNDISVPDFCYTDPLPAAAGTPLAEKEDQPAKVEDPFLNAWFGPEGTVSPLHTDPYHNILCQVVGQKYVRLYSPFESQNLYPKGVENGVVDMSNTSQVDVEADASMLEKMFPRFKDASYVEAVLNEGECLYIPIGWWHFVKSLSVSFSVSFWWN